MTQRQQAVQVSRDQSFKGRQFTAEVILWAVRWYLMFPISYRDLELMLLDRGVEVDHTTIFRWIQAYAVELEKTSCPFPDDRGSRRMVWRGASGTGDGAWRSLHDLSAWTCTKRRSSSRSRRPGRLARPWPM